MNIDLLKDLCETPGVPGREHRVGPEGRVGRERPVEGSVGPERSVEGRMGPERPVEGCVATCFISPGKF